MRGAVRSLLYPSARNLRAAVCVALFLAGTLPSAAGAQTTNYQGADLRGAHFQKARLAKADLQNADLRGVDLRGADLRGANLQNANLQGANLQGAILSGANLQHSNAQDAIFTDANLQGANLESGLFYGANLYGVNLQDADLRGANLQGANLLRTNLRGANLLGANLQGVKRSIPVVLAFATPRPGPTQAPATPAPATPAPAMPAPATHTMSAETILGALAPATPAPATIRLNASRVEFYYDRFLVEADGNVRVRTSDGLVATGDTFSMDLKLNRFLLAGHVHVSDAAGSQDGAAIADFLDFSRIYLVPLTRESQNATGIPDRWTFADGDFAHPLKGREMPGDTFYFPDLGQAKPYLVGTSAVIGSKSFVRFGGGRFDAAEGAGVYIPVPTYYINFSADQHLGDNSLAGANYDATWEFAGNAHSISALHFRYDTINKSYLSFEQHLSGPKAYAVFSVNPMTRPSKFWDLLLSDRPSDKTQVRTFTQLHTFQYGLSSPLESQQVTTLQLTQALHGSYLQGNYQFENFSLLPLGCYPMTPGNTSDHCTVPFHPSNAQISLQTFDRPLTPYFHGARVYEHLSFGFGFQHEAFISEANPAAALQTLGGVPYTTIWQHTLGLEVFMPDLKFGPDLNVPTKYYAINASFQKQRQWNSLPHYIDTTQSRISLSKTLDSHWLSYLDYNVQNVADIYGPLQSTIYPPFTPVVNGVTYPGYEAFHGIATFRTLSFGLNYSNGGNFTFNLLARKHTDFPAPIPFFFQFATPDVLGNFNVQYFLGQPPYDVTAEVRMRINPHMSIDIQRSYFFNYSNLRWSPHFVFQVMQ
jgi:uncharacterized protein YjbI with pentapeptide repeats